MGCDKIDIRRTREGSTVGLTILRL
jgi:hypothetical protein